MSAECRRIPMRMAQTLEAARVHGARWSASRPVHRSAGWPPRSSRRPAHRLRHDGEHRSLLSSGRLPRCRPLLGRMPAEVSAAARVRTAAAAPGAAAPAAAAAALEHGGQPADRSPVGWLATGRPDGWRKRKDAIGSYSYPAAAGRQATAGGRLSLTLTKLDEPLLL